MQKLTRLIVGMIVVTACGDDNNTRIDAPPRPIDAPPVAIDAPAATTFTDQLTTAMEVPVCAAAGAAATGTTTVTISADRSTVRVDTLTFSGLSGPATAAHIHAGAPGVAGPIVFNLGTMLTPPVTATFTAVNYPSPAPAGAPATFAAFIREMLAGNSYLNVHTAACPGGEIRAQLR